MEFRNPVGVAAAGATVAVEILTQTQTANIPAGGTETVLFYAPAGHVYRVVAAFLNAETAPPGATVGSHELRIGVGATLAGPANTTLLLAESDYQTGVTLGKGGEQATLRIQPADQGARAVMLQSIRGSDTIPIGIRYANLTDAVQTAQRVYTLVVERIRV